MNDNPPRMDYRQHRRARRLVHECCNYDGGNCLLLDDGEPCVCVQSMCVPVRFTGENFRQETAQRKMKSMKKLIAD